MKPSQAPVRTYSSSCPATAGGAPMADRPVRVLLVEDDEDDYFLTRELLQDIPGEAYVLDWAADYDAGLEAVCRGGHDVYLLDYRLGTRTGVELLLTARARGCVGPVIILTGQGERESDLEAMRAGAADYLAVRHAIAGDGARIAALAPELAREALA